MSPLAQALAASPDIFPAVLDLRSDVVTLWRLSRDDYQRAAFLDDRLAAGKQARQLAFADVKGAVEAANLAEKCDFIFHIGHVGSTLLSRLLGRHCGLFSLREPAILRTLAATREKSRRDAYLPTLLKLWSRTYEPDTRALIKSTSFVAEIASDLLARPSAPRALAVAVVPEVYLETIFGGANAPAEAGALALARLARLNHRLPADMRLEDLSGGDIVALGWACESLCLAEAARAAGPRMFALDFEEFLASPEETLGRTLAHFGIQASQAELAAILGGSEMHSYSKAQEHRYDVQLRRDVLAEARARYRSEIRQGLLWLERLATRHPLFANALTMFGRRQANDRAG